MEEFRCDSCDRLLMKARLASPSAIEVICGRCGKLNLIFAESKPQGVVMVPDGQGGYLTEVEG